MSRESQNIFLRNIFCLCKKLDSPKLLKLLRNLLKRLFEACWRSLDGRHSWFTRQKARKRKIRIEKKNWKYFKKNLLLLRQVGKERKFQFYQNDYWWISIEHHFFPLLIEYRKMFRLEKATKCLCDGFTFISQMMSSNDVNVYRHAGFISITNWNSDFIESILKCVKVK